MEGKKMTKKKILLGFLFVCITLIFGCTQREGYGVVNWSMPEQNLSAGDMVVVYVRSNVAKTYIAGKEDSSTERFELPLWQLTFFESKKEAEAFIQKTKEYQYTYARVKLDGLPLRNKPENLSKQVYRLKIDQVIKILWKGKGAPVLRKDEPLPGDWFEVMTDDGITGWCFSYNLDLYDERDTTTVVTEAENEGDDADLQMVLSKQWYPESYAGLDSRDYVNLDTISTAHGFSAGVKAGYARIALDDFEEGFSYTRITKTRPGRYHFEGSSLKIRILADDRILVEFTDKSGNAHAEYFVTLTTSVETVIAKVKKQRRNTIRSISHFGPEFKSSNYGTLQILGDGSFLWSGYKLITPSIIPSGSGTAGSAFIKYGLSLKLRRTYQGVISFKFSAGGSVVNFLYTVSADGLRLEYADENHIKDGVLIDRSLNPIILFFAAPKMDD